MTFQIARLPNGPVNSSCLDATATTMASSSSRGLKGCVVMGRVIVAAALRQYLGEDASGALVEFIDSKGDGWKAEVMTACTERQDVRFQVLASREDLIKGLSDIRQEIATQRVELVRWSFLFWIGQMATTAGLIALLVHLVR